MPDEKMVETHIRVVEALCEIAPSLYSDSETDGLARYVIERVEAGARHSMRGVVLARADLLRMSIKYKPSDIVKAAVAHALGDDDDAKGGKDA